MEDMAHRPHMRRNRVRQAAEECAAKLLVQQGLMFLRFSESITDYFPAGMERTTVAVAAAAPVRRDRERTEGTDLRRTLPAFRSYMVLAAAVAEV